ncbi:unnamed protein product [Aphanomyces euteiches]
MEPLGDDDIDRLYNAVWATMESDGWRHAKRQDEDMFLMPGTSIFNLKGSVNVFASRRQAIKKAAELYQETNTASAANFCNCIWIFMQDTKRGVPAIFDDLPTMYVFPRPKSLFDLVPHQTMFETKQEAVQVFVSSTLLLSVERTSAEPEARKEKAESKKSAHSTTASFGPEPDIESEPIAEPDIAALQDSDPKTASRENVEQTIIQPKSVVITNAPPVNSGPTNAPAEDLEPTITPTEDVEPTNDSPNIMESNAAPNPDAETMEAPYEDVTFLSDQFTFDVIWNILKQWKWRRTGSAYVHANGELTFSSQEAVRAHLKKSGLVHHLDAALEDDTALLMSTAKRRAAPSIYDSSWSGDSSKKPLRYCEIVWALEELGWKSFDDDRLGPVFCKPHVSIKGGRRKKVNGADGVDVFYGREALLKYISQNPDIESLIRNANASVGTENEASTPAPVGSTNLATNNSSDDPTHSPQPEVIPVANNVEDLDCGDKFRAIFGALQKKGWTRCPSQDRLFWYYKPGVNASNGIVNESMFLGHDKVRAHMKATGEWARIKKEIVDDCLILLQSGSQEESDEAWLRLNLLGWKCYCDEEGCSYHDTKDSLRCKVYIARQTTDTVATSRNTQRMTYGREASSATMDSGTSGASTDVRSSFEDGTSANSVFAPNDTSAGIRANSSTGIRANSSTGIRTTIDSRANIRTKANTKSDPKSRDRLTFNIEKRTNGNKAKEVSKTMQGKLTDNRSIHKLKVMKLAWKDHQRKKDEAIP